MNTREHSYKVEALVSSLIGAIERHELPAGEKILSIRSAAEHWSVSRNTVVDGYGRLEAHGYIQAKLGSGYYVRETQKQHAQVARSRMITHVLDE
jgi:DNA-binding transcriptional regulator YhcF (GntR family)